MTEEDTIKRLKSITRQEAEAIHQEEFGKLVEEAGYAPNYQGYMEVPYPELSKRVNERLNPYGWTFERLIELRSADHFS